MTPTPTPNLSPKRPYLLRAFYDWIVDNELTPQVIVDAEMEGVSVPRQYVQDNRITLNIAPQSVVSLDLGNDAVTFSARFSGRSFMVYLPISSVLVIYARENGQGLVFSEEESTPPEDSPPKPTKPVLRIVK